MMSQTMLTAGPPEHFLMNRRGLLVFAGLFIQIAVIVLVILSVKRPGESSVALSSVPGNATVCRVSSVTPFSEAWFYGVQVGDTVQVTGAKAGINLCRVSNTTIQVSVAGYDFPLVANDSASHDGNIPDAMLESILIMIFTVTGISIFLRATKRPVARVTYALFYCVSLIFVVLGAGHTNHLWLNVLSFVLLMIGRGLSTTFVCMLPFASSYREGERRASVLPYVPLIVALALIVVPLPLLLLLSPMRIVYILLTLLYNLACLVVVVWMLFRGLRHLNRDEKRIAQMIVVGTLFLLLPLALSISIIRTNTIVQPDLVRLLPVPLTALPIIYCYILFRHRLMGMTSLLGRQAMRVLLWLLLASLFVFPIAILLRFVSANMTNGNEIRVYIFALLLVLSLWLFPLLWSKVRDMGDHVFYRDFYQYNQSLRDLSTALTRLQGLDQISAFILPRLAQLLNVTDVALLVRSMQKEHGISSVEDDVASASGWHIYRLAEEMQNVTNERLTGIARLALTYMLQKGQSSNEPRVLDGVLLLALFDGNVLSGFLCLGPKKNLEPYSRQDTSFLATLAAQLSVLEVNNRYLEQAQADARTLTALNHRVVSAQEDERRHIALELHDEALQQAMLLVRQLSDAGTMMEVAEAMPLARSVVSSLRHTCLELRPPLLDELGVEEALYWLARQTEQHSGQRIAITVSCEGLHGTRLPATVELSLYRVAQETLSNALKYAGASAISLRLRYYPDGKVSLIIADNGRGFSSQHPALESLGLLGMQERMVSIGGQLHIRSSTGHGVAVHATCTHQLLRVVA
jgi:signal transduction histidine kinase